VLGKRVASLENLWGVQRVGLAKVCQALRPLNWARESWAAAKLRWAVFLQASGRVGERVAERAGCRASQWGVRSFVCLLGRLFRRWLAACWVQLSLGPVELGARAKGGHWQPLAATGYRAAS